MIAQRPIETGSVFFTAPPMSDRFLPRPFVAAGRTVALVRTPRPRIAVLGFGLGAIAAIMSRIRPAGRIVGVEVDPRLARRARRSLPAGVELVEADALEFLRRTRRRFDLIFDDCFVLHGSEAERPEPLNRHGGLIAKRLRPGGIYVRNLIERPGAYLGDAVADLEAAFEHVRLRRFRGWENVFALASQAAIDLRGIRRL